MTNNHQITLHSTLNNSLDNNGIVRYQKHLISPTLQLSGHEGPVYSCQFSPDGNKLASCSFDQTILIWNVVDGANQVGIKSIHKNAIIDLKWSRSGRQIYSASADYSVSIFDLDQEQLVKKFRHHEAIVNAISVSKSGPEFLASCSDDNFICVYDMRSVESAFNIEHKYPIISVALDENFVYSAGVDNDILLWDIRTGQVQTRLHGHTDTVTGIKLSPDGNHLLSTSMDNSCKIWDIKPFSSIPNRLVCDLYGAPHGNEKTVIKPAWNSDGSMVGCGSGDQTVVVWDIERKIVKYKLPGHKGTVTQVDFHPSQPQIIATCSIDNSILLGDLSRS